ncbi:ExbD/TolR family protein [Kistimonas asteriae]|uniref:ExbD/TolR family protein n=1 Tax=Kistimonas asteriae TaxID=517724 RepID=UPI001BABC496|nr:biopolymer transporter ExbD [Kistimonas asteriae]
MRARRHITTDAEDTGIDMTPMLDVVFIMLIFFITTATFIQQSGITLERQEAVTAQPIQGQATTISLTEAASIHIDGDTIEPTNLKRYLIKRLLPGTAIIIDSDRKAPGGLLIQVIDIVRQAGFDDITLAAKPGHVQ